MFKYLLLKALFDLSDVDVVERSRHDMSFKYFLHMAPEEPVIDPSSLTKFRKLRLKDLNLLDMLIGKSVELAIQRGVLTSTSIIVDATHTKARYNQKSPREVLKERSRNVRKALYSVDESLKAKLPAKNTVDTLEAELDYCQKLIQVIHAQQALASLPKVREPLNVLKEAVEDDAEQVRLSQDPDARLGHKRADSSFFGYKTHIAMTEERIITAAIVTTGEKTTVNNCKRSLRKAKQQV